MSDDSNKESLVRHWFYDHYRSYTIGNIYKLHFVENKSASFTFEPEQAVLKEHYNDYLNSAEDSSTFLFASSISKSGITSYNNITCDKIYHLSSRAIDINVRFMALDKVQLINIAFVEPSKAPHDEYVDKYVLLRLFFFKEGSVKDVIAYKGYNESKSYIGYVHNLLLK